MKEHHIELKEMETNYLETDKEKKPYSWWKNICMFHVWILHSFTTYGSWAV